jgi:hypothetical protein
MKIEIENLPSDIEKTKEINNLINSKGFKSTVSICLCNNYFLHRIPKKK